MAGAKRAEARRDAPGASCARRRGITAESWRALQAPAITLPTTARIHLYLAEGLTLGPQQLTPSERDFKLMWSPMQDAITAASEGQFLLQGGPLALLLADRVCAAGTTKAARSTT